MKLVRVAFSAVMICVAFGLAAFETPPKPEPKNPQYKLGYQAGRRDERADLCSRFEKHSAAATTLLGDARMILIRAFCTAAPVSN
jgi:hypothetical protein